MSSIRQDHHHHHHHHYYYYLSQDIKNGCEGQQCVGVVVAVDSEGLYDGHLVGVLVDGRGGN